MASPASVPIGGVETSSGITWQLAHKRAIVMKIAMNMSTGWIRWIKWIGWIATGKAFTFRKAGDAQKPRSLIPPFPNSRLPTYHNIVSQVLLPVSLTPPILSPIFPSPLAARHHLTALHLNMQVLIEKCS